jgi:methionyl-tRNA formyltransferase
MPHNNSQNQTPNQGRPDKSRPLRVVYMGTPDFAVPALRALIASRHEVVGVFTQPDRKGGRGKKLLLPPVKLVAEQTAIPVYQPSRVKKNAEALETLRNWQPDVVVVAAYGQILPESILEIPRLGCVNIHASILPKYRGAAPINWAIVRGEKTSGVTLMKMDAGLDTGPMLQIHRVDIPAEMNAQQLHDELSELGASVLVAALDRLQAGTLKATAQDSSKSSYAPMLSRETGRIDWTKSAREIADHIRGFYPWPGSFAIHEKDGERTVIKIHRARVADPEDVSIPSDAQPGDVLRADAAAGSLVVAAETGAVELLEVQAPGKRAMEARDFLNGYDLSVGERLK